MPPAAALTIDKEFSTQSCQTIRSKPWPALSDNKQNELITGSECKCTSSSGLPPSTISLGYYIAGKLTQALSNWRTSNDALQKLTGAQ
jgi:hypothetical protein